MCPDHSDWFGNNGLDAQSRNADRSVVTKFLQAHPTDYATKKLQVGWVLVLVKRQMFLKCNGDGFVFNKFATIMQQ